MSNNFNRNIEQTLKEFEEVNKSAEVLIAEIKAEELEEKLRKTEQQLVEVYTDRNYLVQLTAVLARKAGYNSGIRTPTEDKNWPVIVIDLPQGEVAWHIPKHEPIIQRRISKPYLPYTNEEKLTRIADTIYTLEI